MKEVYHVDIDHTWAVGMADNRWALACLVGAAGDWHRNPRTDLGRWRMVTVKWL